MTYHVKYYNLIPNPQGQILDQLELCIFLVDFFITLWLFYILECPHLRTIGCWQNYLRLAFLIYVQQLKYYWYGTFPQIRGILYSNRSRSTGLMQVSIFSLSLPLSYPCWECERQNYDLQKWYISALYEKSLLGMLIIYHY